MLTLRNFGEKTEGRAKQILLSFHGSTELVGLVLLIVEAS